VHQSQVLFFERKSCGREEERMDKTHSSATCNIVEWQFQGV
jgi:hypothetical protein